jgi:guanosine-3',5'-bis(diphosphate) 3'-pyrophosphohydrolase
MDKLAITSPDIGSNVRTDHTILKAAHFAARKHAGQRRKGATAEPFIDHLLEVAELVSGALSEPDTNLVVAALLHDTIEDAGVRMDELVKLFGSDVADLVIEVTDDKSLPKQERKRLQIVNAHKKSVRAQIITLADKVSNLRSIFSDPPADWTIERKREYFDWAKQVVDGLTDPNPILKEEFERLYQRAGTVI